MLSAVFFLQGVIVLKNILHNRRGFTVVEIIIGLAIAVAVTVTVLGLTSSGIRKKAAGYGTDVNNIKVTAPVFNENTTGNYSFNGTGNNTGIPQNINFN